MLPPAISPPRPSPKEGEGSWQLRNLDESLAGLSWLVAIAAAFLTIGILGLLRSSVYSPITISGRAGTGAVDNDSTDTSMAESPSEMASPETMVQAEMSELETPPVPEVVEPILKTLDLPELTEVMTTEDIFAVPAAPKIEAVQKLIEPNKPQPKSRTASRTSQPARGTVAAPGGTTGSGGGGGGTGTAGSGAGRGRMALPAYPSRARARGVIGSVTLRLVIGPAGRITSATVIIFGQAIWDPVKLVGKFNAPLVVAL